MAHGINGDGHEANTRTDTLADRLPPFNLEAEAGVIGSVLFDPEMMDEVAAAVQVVDFYRANNAAVWAEMVAMHVEGLPVDRVVLCDRLGMAPPACLAGLSAFELADLIAGYANSVPHAVNAKYYADIVRQKAVSRSVIETANAMLRDAYSNNFTAEHLLESAERRLLAVSSRSTHGCAARADVIVPAVLADLAARMAGKPTGLTSGLSDLDDMTCGFRPQNLIYVAARTSVGKSALAVNIVDHLAVKQDRPVLYVTLEMSREEVIERLIIVRCGLDGKRVRSGQLSAPELAVFRASSARIHAAPIIVESSESLTVTQIASIARRFKARDGIEIVVVDLVNLISGEDERLDRRVQLAFISRRLKRLARELDVPVLALAQINRKPEEREGKRPRMGDIKDCGNLEEDADQVLILHRPEYYNPVDSPGEAIVIVAKNRNAPTGDVRLAFQKTTMRFDNLARTPEPAGPDF